MDDMKIDLRAQAIRDIAAKDGLTIDDLGKQLGVSRAHMYRVMAGDRTCSWQMLVSLAAALNVSPTTVADVSAKAAA